MRGRAEPSAGRGSDGPAFEPFRLERETKPDGRAILFYSWPEEIAAPAGVQNADRDPESAGQDVRERAPEPEPWSPETQPADPEGRDV